MSDNSNIIRTLSTGTIISSLLFSKLPATKQTEILAVAQAADKPFVFVDSFGTLSNTRKLAERLLNGEDVSMELEFNNIELTDDDRKGLELVRPLLAKLKEASAIKVGDTDLDQLFGTDADAVRKWIKGEEHYASNLPYSARTNLSGKRNVLRIYGTNVECISGYNVSQTAFKRHYPALLAAIEKGQKDMVTIASVRVGYENRQLKLNENGTLVKLGCQQVPVSEVLRIGAELGL